MSIIPQIHQKTLPYILAAGLALGTLTGCRVTHTEVSDVLHEDAKVVQTIYSPSRHGSGVSPQINNLFSDDGPSFELEITSIDMSEEYAVVFECQHGKFVSEGSDQRHKDLWSRLKEGQEVDVTYKEIYRTTYEEDKDGDGEKDLVERVLTGFDFLDAQPKEK